MDILREPTRAELSGDVTDESSPAFVPIALPGGKVETVKSRFEKRIIKEEKKAYSEGLPFPVWAVSAEVKDIQDDFNKKFRRQGYIRGFKIPTLDELDWSKYSDLKNWEVIDQGAKHDAHLSKIHRLPVFVKWTKYMYKGYSNTCTLMEGEELAVIRAQETIDNRRAVDKNIKPTEGPKAGKVVEANKSDKDKEGADK